MADKGAGDGAPSDDCGAALVSPTLIEAELIAGLASAACGARPGASNGEGATDTCFALWSGTVALDCSGLEVSALVASLVVDGTDVAGVASPGGGSEALTALTTGVAGG